MNQQKKISHKHWYNSYQNSFLEIYFVKISNCITNQWTKNNSIFIFAAGRTGHFFRENTLAQKDNHTTRIDIKNFCSKIFRQNKKQVQLFSSALAPDWAAVDAQIGARLSATTQHVLANSMMKSVCYTPSRLSNS